MFRFSANEQLLADWVFIQNQPNGLFPETKGWKIRFQLKTPQAGGRPFFLLEASHEEETLYLVPTSPLCSKAVYDSIASLQSSGSQLILLCGEAWEEALLTEVYKRSLQKSLLVLSLSEEGMRSRSGTWKNSRLEFRLLNQSLSAWDIPHHIPLNPSLIEDETILARCFLEILTTVTQQWLAKETSVKYERLLNDSLILFSVLDKGTRKELSTQFLYHVEQLCQGPLKGWLRVERYKKKPQSEPTLRLTFESSPTNRGEVLKQLRKQSQALHFLRNQALQTSYYDTETDSF